MRPELLKPDFSGALARWVRITIPRRKPPR